MMDDRHNSLKNHFKGSELLCKKVVSIFSLISNKTRFRIICLLSMGDFCVNEIVDIINAGEVSYISQQLKALSLAGIISNKRVKKNVVYSLKDKKIRELVKFLQGQYMNKLTSEKLVKS